MLILKLFIPSPNQLVNCLMFRCITILFVFRVRIVFYIIHIRNNIQKNMLILVFRFKLNILVPIKHACVKI